MIITNNIRIYRILKITWKIDLLVLISCIAAYYLYEYLISKIFIMPAMIPTVLGTALAFFIGFNNNQAYARWWEARQIWGSLVNNSRTWARGVINYCYTENRDYNEVRDLQRKIVHRHIGFLYALKAALRNQHWDDYKKYLSQEDIRKVEKHTNKHNAILDLQSRDLETVYRDGWLDGFKFTHLNDMIVSFCDDMGKSERIKGTVFPTTYNFFTRVFIWLFSIILTIVASETADVWAVVIGSIVSVIFHTTHIIGMLLVNPFEPVATGIALDQITRTIEINLLEMLGEKNVPGPVKPISGEYVM